MCPGLSSDFFYQFFGILFFVQAADGGLDFRVIPPTASPSEQSTSTGKKNKKSPSRAKCLLKDMFKKHILS